MSVRTDTAKELSSNTPSSENMVEHTNKAKNLTANRFEDYGYFFFPERFDSVFQQSSVDKFFSLGESRVQLRKKMCEENVQKCLNSHPGVKMMLSAMKSVGCEVNLLRHFSCEQCDTAVRGGFDPSTNQSIICYNTVNVNRTNDVAMQMIDSLIQPYDYCRANYNTHNLQHLACTQVVLCHNRVFEYADCAEILMHELIHAFDYCRGQLDIANDRHVACTEIRAANLTACTMGDVLSTDSISFSGMRFKYAQRECVRRKAALSLQMVRNVSESDAYRAVDSVFEKCYADLEPFGRRVLDEKSCIRAYRDRHMFGYK